MYVCVIAVFDGGIDGSVKWNCVRLCVCVLLWSVGAVFVCRARGHGHSVRCVPFDCTVVASEVRVKAV